VHVLESRSRCRTYDMNSEIWSAWGAHFLQLHGPSLGCCMFPGPICRLNPYVRFFVFPIRPLCPCCNPRMFFDFDELLRDGYTPPWLVPCVYTVGALEPLDFGGMLNYTASLDDAWESYDASLIVDRDDYTLYEVFCDYLDAERSELQKSSRARIRDKLCRKRLQRTMQQTPSGRLVRKAIRQSPLDLFV
jgi:hypothetical protein